METSRKVQNKINVEIILKSYWELHTSNIYKLIDKHAVLSVRINLHFEFFYLSRFKHIYT